TFMRDRGIARDLQARVRDYYNYMWENRAGRQQSEMLSDLPPPLRTEIALHLNRPVLEKVPIFKGASDAALRELSVHMEPTVCVPGQAIVRRGETGDELFFINSGLVEVRSYDETQVVAELGDGDFFGEMALIESKPRANTVNALEHCNLYVLDRSSFERVLAEFPEFAAQVRAVAERRRAESDEVGGA
ncbi:MAG: cyclic nucleotide-binding domain-containing protein, partial [Acidimicrobiia bacterium]|nr:cyclic nucleotide-binding domain-containing protein [Acidimicrobiia bacterium]